ncbi:MAG: hypothetical protein J6C89_03240 [Clostridia bacterium]|nr:hypothetical protein [Clostridia bacterium]
MKEQTWKRKEYDTWDEAFRALAPVIRQQSVRVASYAQVLFVQACASSYGTQTAEGAERMNGKYAELAYKCGMYHQLGKALVPAEYQVWQSDFTEEEQALYRKYTSDGRLLVARLQEKTLRQRTRRRGADTPEEAPTENIPWLMIRETCGQHMERWDGTGYPDGRKGAEISPIAQVVGLAKELDRLTSETKSEDPFAEAYEKLLAEGGKAFSHELIDVLRSARAKCRAVYRKYLPYTLTIPKTIPLVEKRKDRPMGLDYSAVVNRESGSTVAYEAIPWFGGIAEDPSEKEEIADVEEQLLRLELVEDMTFYFLYEAADAVLRIENCKLDIEAIVLHMIPSFFAQGTQLPRFQKLWKDQPIDKKKLVLAIPQIRYLELDKDGKDTVKRYIKNDISIMLDGWDPAVIPAQELIETGFTHVRVSAASHLKHETADAIALLAEKEITLYSDPAESEDAQRWLAACGVHRASAMSHPIDEDEMIKESLLRERNE